MRAVLLRTVGLAAIYLAVLTSLAPGDVLVGALLGLGAAAALYPRRAAPRGASAASAPVRLRAVVRTAVETAWEMAVGTGKTVRFCLGAYGEPGFVEVPRDDRSTAGIALWGVLTGESPDEIPVDVDEERGVLLVHLVDASDPDAVRARHERARERWQRDVVR